MADILQDVRIEAPVSSVFEAISTPAGLDSWWTKSSSGEPREGAEYRLQFGPGHDWGAKVVACQPGVRFELQMTDADADWEGTRIGFEVVPNGAATTLRFSHRRWPQANEHYRISCYCWAMYLRILRRYLEHGERVPYDARLDV